MRRGQGTYERKSREFFITTILFFIGFLKSTTLQSFSFDLVRRPVGPKAQVENAEKVIKKLSHVLELPLKNYLIF